MKIKTENLTKIMDTVEFKAELLEVLYEMISIKNSEIKLKSEHCIKDCFQQELDNCCLKRTCEELLKLCKDPYKCSGLTIVDSTIDTFDEQLETIKYFYEYIQEEVYKIAFQASVYNNIDLLKKVYSLYKIENGDELLRNAIRIGNIKIVEFLHQQGANFSKNSIIVSSNRGHLDIVKFLLKNGADEELIKNEEIKYDMKIMIIYTECMRRIHYHPGLERTITENLNILEKYQKHFEN